MSVAVFAAVPLALVAARFGLDSLHLVDFRSLWHASRDVLDGRSPYRPSPDPRLPVTADCLGSGPDCFVYPPLTALLTVPLGLLPFAAAGTIFFALDVAALLAALRVLGVRDWRCYGVVLASGPALSAVEGGTLTPLLVLCVAVAWRYRDNRAVASITVAAAVVAKLFLWPLVIWFIATRRASTAALAVAIGAVICVATWAPLGFAGVGVYPERLHALTHVWQSRAYSPVALGLALGLPSRTATLLGLVAGGAVLAAAVRVGRRGNDDQRSFALTISAVLLLSPLIWLNSFLLLLVPLAIARPTLSRAWALTVPFLFLPGMADGHAPVIAVGLALLAAITWASVGSGPPLDLPEPVGDERHALPRLANADGV